MKTKNILSLILLLTILCGFNSCEDKPFDGIDDLEYILCNGSGWFEEYTDIDGYLCHQQLFFNPDGSGKEVITRFFDYSMQRYERISDTFLWSWNDDYGESIYMRYPNGDYIIFDDLRIFPDELSGYLGEDLVHFVPF